MSTDTVSLIERTLRDAFDPRELRIHDDSHLHAGHAGAAGGGGHYRVHVVADAFAGHTLVERHRMVYAALGHAMRSSIHALSITARAPGE